VSGNPRVRAPEHLRTPQQGAQVALRYSDGSLDTGQGWPPRRDISPSRAGARTYGSREDNPTAYRQLDHELATIDKLTSRYFLIVHDIVEFCRRENIYCQGRGSAANSAVCYALGITNVDAVRRGLLFERCLSPERDWPRVPGVRSFPLADARPAPRH